MSKSTRELSLCSVMTALAVVLLWLGGVLPLAMYACPMFASIILVVVKAECRRSYAWSCYAASAILALLLTPDKECAMLYVVLGYYPLIYPALQKLRPRMLGALIKLLIFTAAVALMYAVLLFIIALPETVEEFALGANILMALTAAVGVFAFFVYDSALGRMMAAYGRYRAKHRKVVDYR